jgi:hypothetical protein
VKDASPTRALHTLTAAAASPQDANFVDLLKQYDAILAGDAGILAAGAGGGGGHALGGGGAGGEAELNDRAARRPEQMQLKVCGWVGGWVGE